MFIILPVALPKPKAANIPTLQIPKWPKPKWKPRLVIRVKKKSYVGGGSGGV